MRQTSDCGFKTLKPSPKPQTLIRVLRPHRDPQVHTYIYIMEEELPMYLRWILQTLQDPNSPTPWEPWHTTALLQLWYQQYLLEAVSHRVYVAIL